MGRSLGSAGQMFWLLNQNRPVHFAVYVEVEGPTSVEGWRKALDQMQQRHPNFAASILLDEFGQPYLQPMPAATIPLRIVAGGVLEQEIGRELATPIDAEEAPLVRAVLLHQADRAIFILVAHHAIADGRSLVFAIRDTLHALTGKMLDPPPRIGSLDAWFAALPERHAGADLPSALTVQPFTFRARDQAAPRVRQFRLTADATERLRRRCREEGATIQCALAAAAAEAVRQLSAPLCLATIRVSSPIDFRRVMGAEDEVAPLGAGVMVPMEPHAAFWDAARFAKAVIEPARTPAALASMIGQIGPFMASQPGVADVAAFWAEHLGYDVNVSNLGEIPIESRIGDLTLTGFGGPAILIGFSGEQGIGVATIGGALNLLHSSYDPLPGLLELMADLLISACG